MPPCWLAGSLIRIFFDIIDLLLCLLICCKVWFVQQFSQILKLNWFNRKLSVSLNEQFNNNNNKQLIKILCKALHGNFFVLSWHSLAFSWMLECSIWRWKNTRKWSWPNSFLSLLHSFVLGQQRDRGGTTACCHWRRFSFGFFFS